MMNTRHGFTGSRQPEPAAAPTVARDPVRAPQRRVIRTAVNRFELDGARVPRGMTYAWRRVSLAGLEDRESQINCSINGWTPVPCERHPELTGGFGKAGEAIVRGGLMLMEQPAEYHSEAVEMDEFAARNAVESQIQRLGLQGRRAGAPSKIKRTVEPVQVEAVEP